MHERPAVVDTDDDGTPVGEVRDAHASSDGERTRRRGERVLIESFAAGGSTPLELCAIPRRHADLNRSRRRRFVSKERATCRQQLTVARAARRAPKRPSMLVLVTFLNVRLR